MNNKRAFTMVELIFVIVILGILAAVAVPRLNASRQDAEIAKFRANLHTLNKDILSYFAANGSIISDENCPQDNACHADLRKMTSVQFDRVEAWSSSKLPAFFYFKLDGKDCVSVLAMRLTDGKEAYSFSVEGLFNSNPLCEKALDTPEMLPLFEGYTSSDFTTRHNAVRSAKSNRARQLSMRWLNENLIEF